MRSSELVDLRSLKRADDDLVARVEREIDRSCDRVEMISVDGNLVNVCAREGQLRRVFPSAELVVLNGRSKYSVHVVGHVIDAANHVKVTTVDKARMCRETDWKRSHRGPLADRSIRHDVTALHVFDFGRATVRARE